MAARNMPGQREYRSSQTGYLVVVGICTTPGLFAFRAKIRTGFEVRAGLAGVPRARAMVRSFDLLPPLASDKSKPAPDNLGSAAARVFVGCKDSHR